MYIDLQSEHQGTEHCEVDLSKYKYYNYIVISMYIDLQSEHQGKEHCEVDLSKYRYYNYIDISKVH